MKQIYVLICCDCCRHRIEASITNHRFDLIESELCAGLFLSNERLTASRVDLLQFIHWLKTLNGRSLNAGYSPASRLLQASENIN